MRISCLATAGLLMLAAGRLVAQAPASLPEALAARIAASGAEVALVYRPLGGGEGVAIRPRLRFHAASTMKLPVLIELARRIDAGELRWEDELVVRNRFASIVDGSPYRLSAADDSDSTLYAAEGQRVPVRRLAELMIARSSNLATNLLIERLDPARVQATARALGADSIEVRRGVEDGKAYERGLNNTTTAADLAALLAAVAEGRAAWAEGSREIVRILLAQEFNDGIPAGLPPGARVAHKTGEITRIAHDAAIVYPEGGAPYVLVILTRGLERREDAARLMAELARLVHAHAAGIRPGRSAPPAGAPPRPPAG